MDRVLARTGGVGDLVAVELRQAGVEKDDLGPEPARDLQRLETLVSTLRFVTDEDCVLVVIHDQDAPARRVRGRA